MSEGGTLRIELPNLAATRRFGARLGGLLGPGDVIGLEGPLGSGKSEIARAAIRARAGAEIEVPSPSFTLIQDYELIGLTIRHGDLYRIGEASEVDELGLLDNDGVALLLEWPERAGGRLEIGLNLRISQGEGEDARMIALTSEAIWADRIEVLVAS